MAQVRVNWTTAKRICQDAKENLKTADYKARLERAKYIKQKANRGLFERLMDFEPNQFRTLSALKDASIESIAEGVLTDYKYFWPPFNYEQGIIRQIEDAVVVAYEVGCPTVHLILNEEEVRILAKWASWSP